MFTPINIKTYVDWSCFLGEIEFLNESELRVMNYCGINPGYIRRYAHSINYTLPESSAEEINKARIYRRFYAALQLRALCQEVPISTVSKRFNVDRGTIQELSTNCCFFAASMISFCQRLGMGMFAAVLDHMADRLQAGAQADLLELAKLPFVKGRTARILWDNGYKNIRHLAEADAVALAAVLRSAQPRKKRDQAEEEGYIRKMKARARVVIAQAEILWEKEQLYAAAEESQDL
jgi:hypothetical protein